MFSHNRQMFDVDMRNSQPAHILMVFSTFRLSAMFAHKNGISRLFSLEQLSASFHHHHLSYNKSQNHSALVFRCQYKSIKPVYIIIVTSTFALQLTIPSVSPFVEYMQLLEEPSRRAADVAELRVPRT